MLFCVMELSPPIYRASLWISTSIYFIPRATQIPVRRVSLLGRPSGYAVFVPQMLSLKFQANDTSVENVTTCVATTLSGVRGLGTILNVSRNKQAMPDAIAAHLQRRFSSFENEDIFKNMFIFNFKNWP